VGCQVVFKDEGGLSVLILTPVMIRAHELPGSSTVCFVDSTGSCNAQNFSVTFMLTPCAAGAVPLAVIITWGQTEGDYIGGFGLLRSSGCRLFDGAGHPAVFMTDDNAALRNALSTVWLDSNQLLCFFHVPQANWRWLWDSTNGIVKDDRPTLMKQFHRIMLATNDIEAELQFRYCVNSALAAKYPHWKAHVQSYWTRKDQWCLAWRLSVMRGHHTNNFSEVTVRLFKDIVLSRVKAYNAVALVDFVCTAMEQYYSRRLLDFAHSRMARPVLWLGQLLKKAEYVQPSAVLQASDTEFYVPSSADSSLLYTVDVVNGVCSCVDGMFGHFCKHQAAVMHHKPGLCFFMLLGTICNAYC